MLANGHPDAANYTVGMLLDEGALVRERIRRQDVNQAIWTRRAVAAVLDKEGAKAFTQHVKDAENGQE